METVGVSEVAVIHINNTDEYRLCDGADDPNGASELDVQSVPWSFPVRLQWYPHPGVRIPESELCPACVERYWELREPRE